MPLRRILLTHTAEMRHNYYGQRAIGGLRALGEVTLHEGVQPLDTSRLIEAARECQIIVADRATPCGAEAFAAVCDTGTTRRGDCWLPMIHPISSPNIVPDTPNTIASRVMTAQS